MIDARFDDLTGMSASFRLSEPVGVLEAMHADEVIGVLEAAEAATARGLWAAGYVAYEAASGVDPALRVVGRRQADPFSRMPLAWFAMFERREETVLPEPQHDPEPDAAGVWRPSIDRARYDRSVASIRNRIAAGDTYQVNYTFRLRSRVDGDERGLYRDLCYAQRGAYSGYLNLGRYRVLSASPELFFEMDGGRLTTRPMKGTAPRGRWSAEDEDIAARLRGSVKDRAENAMIVDLLRNDMGRVARAGSVTWSDVFDLERYETVWQLTSTVSAERRAGAGLADVFAALFPCGSVTGAPKVATMDIIADLEDSPRGVYCGAVGFLSPPGSGAPGARFNVAIRTVVVDTESRTAEYGVGGGITWDSSARDEFDEAIAKAQVLTARRPRFELLETLRSEPGEGLRHLERHLDRLEASASYFGFRVDRAAVRRALSDEAATIADRPSRIRAVVDRSGGVRTGALPLAEPPGTLRLALDLADPVDPSDPMLFHKTTRRARYEDARARHPDVDDVVLTNLRGEATESTVANLAIKRGGRWVTPPLDHGLLPGIAREVALQRGDLTEESITIEALMGADEVALVSDVRGWRRAEVVADGPAGG